MSHKEIVWHVLTFHTRIGFHEFQTCWAKTFGMLLIVELLAETSFNTFYCSFVLRACQNKFKMFVIVSNACGGSSGCFITANLYWNYLNIWNFVSTITYWQWRSERSYTWIMHPIPKVFCHSELYFGVISSSVSAWNTRAYIEISLGLPRVRSIIGKMLHYNIMFLLDNQVCSEHKLL